MSNLGFGRPRTEVNIIDSGSLYAKSLAGYGCVQGVTLMGEPYKPVFIPTWDAFKQEYGGLHPNDDFPLYCKRALDSGAKLYVSRVAHWDSGSSDWEGAKASVTITVSSNSIIFTAKSVGAGYNGVVITVSAAKSGDTTKVDITETLGNTVSTIKDIAKTSVSSDLPKINAGLKYTVVNSLPTTIPVGSGTLAGGSQTYSSITDNDFIGDRTTRTLGWFAFDTVQDSMRIFNFNRPSFPVDDALRAYCEMRRDMRFVIRPALSDSLDWQKIIDYRMGTGSYTHTPIDSFWGDLDGGNILVANPDNVSEVKQISSIADVAGLRLKKDASAGVWKSTAGATRGVLKNTLGVPYNLGVPAFADYFDQVYNKQVNMVIDDDSFGVVYWGNRTLLRDQSKRLRASHSADLAVYVKRSLYAIVRSKNFEPNSPSYWHSIYRSAKPFIETLEDGEAIVKGENSYWFWQGDQDAKSPSDLKYNKQDEVDQGIYRARFLYVDIALMEWIGIDVQVTNSSTVVEIANNIN